MYWTAQGADNALLLQANNGQYLINDWSSFGAIGYLGVVAAGVGGGGGHVLPFFVLCDDECCL